MNQIQHQQSNNNKQQFANNNNNNRQQQHKFQKRKYNDANQQQQQQRPPFNNNNLFKQQPLNLNEKNGTNNFYYFGGGNNDDIFARSQFQMRDNENGSQLFDTTFNFSQMNQQQQHQNQRGDFFYQQPISQFGANFSAFGGTFDSTNVDATTPNGDDNYCEPVFYGYDENTGMFGCFNNNNNNSSNNTNKNSSSGLMMNQAKTNFNNFTDKFGTTYFNNNSKE